SFFGISNGFQAAANVSEETQNARMVVPRVLMQTLIIASVIELLLIGALIVAAGNRTAALATSPTAMSDVVRAVLGDTVNKIFLVVAMYNVFVTGLVVFLQVTRYMWAMARDG